MFGKFECKHCNFTTYSAIHFAIHLKKTHNIKMTKNDWKFAFRHHILTACFLLLLHLPRFLILLICYPFHWVYENLE